MKKIYNFFITLITRLIVLAFIVITAVGLVIIFKPTLLARVSIYPFDENTTTGIILVENESLLNTEDELCLIVFIDEVYLEYLGEVETVTLAINKTVKTYELTESYSKKAYMIFIDKTTETIEYATEKSSDTTYKGYTWEKVITI